MDESGTAVVDVAMEEVEEDSIIGDDDEIIEEEDEDALSYAALELQPDVAIIYMQQLLALGLVRVPLTEMDGGVSSSVHGDTLQVSLESFLVLETELEKAVPTDERVQIVHKLLLDLLNAALRAEAIRHHTSRAPRLGGRGPAGDALPLGGWKELPNDNESLQRIVDNAVQQTLGWLMQANAAEDMPVEVQLSCLLDQDAADIERGWQEATAHKEHLIAETADGILGTLLEECAGEMDLGGNEAEVA